MHKCTYIHGRPRCLPEKFQKQMNTCDCCLHFIELLIAISMIVDILIAASLIATTVIAACVIAVL